VQLIDGGLEVRLFNPLSTTTENRLHTEKWPGESREPQWIQPVNFESTMMGDPKPIDHSIQLKPKQILTFRLL
jgi:hypothetical protein